MNTARIQALVAAKSGLPPADHRANLSGFMGCLKHPDVRDYLTSCLPQKSYSASGIRVHNLKSIQDEVCAGAGPGGYIFPHGYLVVASSIRGNAVCFHSPSGRVVWADHEGFADEIICYRDRDTGVWHNVEFSPANIELGLVELSGQIESFLEDLLADRLQEKLEALD